MAGELVERLNWWAAKRKPPTGMETLPADCREAADRIESLEREIATLRADLEQSRSVEETTHGLYQFWNKKAAELSASNDALRAERDEVRRKAIQEAAQIAESLDPNADDIAAAIRNMGGEG